MAEPTPPLPAGWSPNVAALGDQWASLDVAVRDAALRWSIELLWKLSGRQFGLTEVTLAPYIPPPRRGYFDNHYRLPVGLNAAARFAGGGVCSPARTFRLPGRAIAVAEVVVDGAVLDEAAWTLDPDGTLVRTDGGGWPVAQDVYLPRWVVRYTHGLLAPPDANQAAARYALELARAAVADPRCKLPARVRDVTRQGISLSMAAPEELADAGLTGVAAVDAWLRSVNPDGLPQAATIWSPALTRHRVIAVHRDGEE